MKKKIAIILITLITLMTIIVITLVGYKLYQNSDTYTYEWVEVKESTIGQYTLYVNNSIGKHIDGTVRITYLNGESEIVEIPKEGTMYVKDIIVKVSNPKKK